MDQCYWCEKYGVLDFYKHEGVMRKLHPRCISWLQGKSHKPKKGEAIYSRRVNPKDEPQPTVPQCICVAGRPNPTCFYNAKPAIDQAGSTYISYGSNKQP